jgi:D-psicose/D-tagatose/L-ribulose 3-epimerase
MSQRPIAIPVAYWMQHWTDDPSRFVARARDAGYDGVEVSIMPDHELPLERLQTELSRHGLTALCSTGLTPQTDISAPDASVRLRGIEHLKRALESAAAIGSPILGGVTYGPWLFFPPVSERQARLERSAGALREVASTAADLGVTVCVEALNRFEGSLINTVAEGLAYLALVDHEAVRLQLDTFHLNIEEDDLSAALRAAGPLLGHFQCASNSRRGVQHGHVDWFGVRSALDDIGYHGWISFEAFPDPTTDIGRATHTWRRLALDLDQEARDAALFIREVLA